MSDDQKDKRLRIVPSIGSSATSALAPYSPDTWLMHCRLEDVARVFRAEIERILEDRGAAQAPVLLNQEQLAKALGCSTRTVYTLREQGCPHVMLLESPRFVLANVLQWMENRTEVRAA